MEHNIRFKAFNPHVPAFIPISPQQQTHDQWYYSSFPATTVPEGIRVEDTTYYTFPPQLPLRPPQLASPQQSSASAPQLRERSISSQSNRFSHRNSWGSSYSNGGAQSFSTGNSSPYSSPYYAGYTTPYTPYAPHASYTNTYNNNYHHSYNYNCGNALPAPYTNGYTSHDFYRPFTNHSQMSPVYCTRVGLHSQNNASSMLDSDWPRQLQQPQQPQQLQLQLQQQQQRRKRNKRNKRKRNGKGKAKKKDEGEGDELNDDMTQGSDEADCHDEAEGGDEQNGNWEELDNEIF